MRISRDGDSLKAAASGLARTPSKAERNGNSDLLAMQRSVGNAAVASLMRGRREQVIQRQVPAAAAASPIPGVGLALSAATFTLAMRPSGTDAFINNNVQFNYSRDTPGPQPPREQTHTQFFQLDSIKGFGSSFAFLQLVLRTDGQNILAAYTEQAEVEGYDGGMLGSEAAVNFSAVRVSEPTDPVTKAYILVQGFNNPSGPGFQRFRAKYLVSGGGEVEPVECVITSGGGRAAAWGEGYKVGWD